MGLGRAREDLDNEQYDPPPRGKSPHRTGVNDLLHYSSGGATAHPVFELSRIGDAEAPPSDPPYGLMRRHLLNLTELHPDETNESGCVGCAVSGI